MEGRFVDTRAEPVEIKRRRLPHWTAEDGVYFVTFRLADSLPVAYASRLKAEFARIEGLADAKIRDRERRALLREAEDRLDRGFGSCLLLKEENSALVSASLSHFDGDRYDLYAWAVMPNHVHVLVHPKPPHDLSSILHSWKGFTSHKIKAPSGRLWQPESFDHLVRSESSFLKFKRYIAENPVNAGLAGWRWVWTSPDLNS